MYITRPLHEASIAGQRQYVVLFHQLVVLVRAVARGHRHLLYMTWTCMGRWREVLVACSQQHACSNWLGWSSSSPATLQLLVGFALHALYSLLGMSDPSSLLPFESMAYGIYSDKEPALALLIQHKIKKAARESMQQVSCIAFAYFTARQVATSMQCKSPSRNVPDNVQAASLLVAGAHILRSESDAHQFPTKQQLARTAIN